MKTHLENIFLALVTLISVLAIPILAKADRGIIENPRLVIVVNSAKQGEAIDAQRIEAFVDGELFFKAVVSTAKEKKVHAGPSTNYPEGREYWAHTPTGAFTISRRSINHVSSTWQGANMPFAQFFVGGIALHATTPEHFEMLGQRDSGGCVRMHPRDAKIVWELVSRIGSKVTQIYVYDGSETPHPLGRLGEVPRHGQPSMMN